jgi:hypothetical protein
LKLGDNVGGSDGEVVPIERVVEPGIAMGEKDERLDGVLTDLIGRLEAVSFEFGDPRLVSTGSAFHFAVDRLSKDWTECETYAHKSIPFS